MHSTPEHMLGDRLLTFLLLQNTHASETRFLGLPLAVVVLGPACVSMLKDLYRGFRRGDAGKQMFLPRMKRMKWLQSVDNVESSIVAATDAEFSAEAPWRLPWAGAASTACHCQLKWRLLRIMACPVPRLLLLSRIPLAA